MDGYASSPNPSSSKFPVPQNTSRKIEVILMSLFYKNNIFNQTLWNLDKVPSLLCSACNEEEETADHIIFHCSAVEESLQTTATLHYKRANNVGDGETMPEPYIGLLNACKDPSFITTCIDIISSLSLRDTVQL